MDDTTLDPEYLKQLKPSFLHLFINFVKICNVISLFHKYNINVLTEIDVENIKTLSHNKGDREGSILLFERLVLYKGWYACLLQVLRDRDARLSHVAHEMEVIKGLLDEQILSEQSDDQTQTTVQWLAGISMLTSGLTTVLRVTPHTKNLNNLKVDPILEIRSLKLKIENERLKKELEEVKKHLMERNQSFEQQHLEANSVLSSDSSDVDQLAEKMCELCKSSKEMLKQNEILQTELREAYSDSKAFCEKLNQEKEVLQTELGHLKMECSDRKYSYEKLHQEKEKLQTELDNLKMECSDRKDAYEKLHKEKGQPVGDNKQPKVNMKNMKFSRNEANNLDGEINGAPTLATINLDETNNEHSLQTDDTLSTETKFNPKTFQVKSSILLIGTKSRNIERFKSSLLGKPITTTLTSRKWSVFKNKTKSVHESSDNILHAPEIQDNSEKKRGKASKERNGNNGSSNIHLCYSNRNDRVFKLVDGPVYDDREVDKFKDEMKSCLVLCREGYNTVVVVYTSDKEREATCLIDILRENFAFNMNNLIVIKTKYVHYRENKPPSNTASNVAQMQDDCIETESTVDFRGTKTDLKFRELFTNKYIGLQLPATDDNINYIFRFIDEMGKANSVSLFVKYDRTLTSNTILETVLTELSLLMETITKRKNKHQRETEQRFKLLQETWEKCVNYNVDNLCESGNNVLIQEEEFEDMEDEREETGREFEKEASRQKQEVCEDVAYLIKCLNNVYFAAQQIERNEKILLPYVMKIFQNFHDWYVESIISNKDTVLESNYKMRIYQKFEKRRHKTI